MKRDYDMNDLKELIIEYFGYENNNSKIYVKDIKKLTGQAISVNNIFIDGEGDIIIEIDKTLL